MLGRPLAVSGIVLFHSHAYGRTQAYVVTAVEIAQHVNSIRRVQG